MLDRIQTPALNTIELPDSIEAVNDYFYKHGWTDGLPVIPPTAERVERMLSGMSWRSPDAIIGLIPPGMGVATLRTIAVNAGMEGAVVANNVKKTKDKSHGYDALNDRYGDMFEFGIVDPAKVTRSALQNAASVACLLLTTESVIADIPKKDEGGDHDHHHHDEGGGGMGGMGGMGMGGMGGMGGMPGMM